MVAFARFLLILFIVFFIIRVVTRYFLKSYFTKMQRNFEDQQSQYQNKKEGDVTLNAKTTKGKKVNNDAGDYVDYEEVDDK